MATIIHHGPAEVHVIDHRVGDAWTLLVTLPFAIDDHTLTATLFPTAGDPISLAVDKNEQVPGQLTISLTAAQSTAAGAGFHHWCFVVTPPGSPAKPRTYLAGRFEQEACG